jgi:hypothetical protein
MFNLFSTFNTAVLSQGNYQAAGNVALNSPFAYQGISQGANNGATVIQLG